MRAVLVLCLLGAAPAFAEGLGIKTEDPELQAFANLGDDARYERWKELVNAGQPSVPKFVAMLGEKHNALRALGGSGLAQLGPLAADAVPKLRAIVKDAAALDKAKLVAIHALGNIGPDAADATPELQALIGSKRRIDVITATVALAKIDPRAKRLPEAITALIGVGRMETPRMLAVAQQLGARARGARDAVAQVARSSRSRFVRRQALRTLVAIDPDSEATVALLRELLKDEESLVSLEAAALLAAKGDRDKGVVAVLTRELGSAAPAARATAAVAMLRIEPVCLNAINRLLVALDSATTRDQAATVEALLQLRWSGRAANAYADDVERIAPRSAARVEGEAALTMWALTGDRERTLKIAKRALARGYFDHCADVVRLARRLEK